MKRSRVKGILMSRGKASTNRRYILFGYALMMSFFWLAINAFIASHVVDSDISEYSHSNLYVSSNATRNAFLATSIEIKSKDLEFMVWNQERRKLSQELSESLRQRINLDPFNGALWLHLSYLQKDAGVSRADRAWTIERASKLLRWNFNQRSELSYHCISEYHEFRKVSADLCSSIILNLPSSWPDAQKANRANVKLSELHVVLALEQANIDDSGVR